jgi:predicted enzyme related to lactoylglutathione lyase
MATRKRSRPGRSPARKRGAPKSARTSTPRKPAARRHAAPAKKSARTPKRSARRAAAKSPAAPPSAIGVLMQHMDYTSQSMDEVKRFYTELLGFKQFMQMTGDMNYLMVHTGPSSSIGFMPPMEGAPDQWRPPREPNLYFMVKDVDAAYRTLSSKGLSFDQPPQDTPWGHRVAQLRDPEGRCVCLAQQMKK